MLNTIWSSPIILALIAALCYGISSPVMKIGMVYGGASPNAMLVAYGLGALLIGVLWWKIGSESISIGTNSIGILALIAVGLLLGTAFVSIIRAFTLPMGSVTLVMTLVAAYPVLSSAIEIFFMNARIRPAQALLGCVLVIAGGITVSASVLPNEK